MTLGSWAFSIFAAVLSMAISLSVVYGGVEKLFAVHRPLHEHDILSVTDQQGNSYTQHQIREWVKKWNRLVYVDQNRRYVPDMSGGIHIHLTSGVTLDVAEGGRFWEVGKSSKHKQIYYWLTEHA